MLVAHGALDLQIPPHVIALEDLFDAQIDFGGAAQSSSSAQDALTQCHEGLGGGDDIAMSSGALVQGEQRAPHPDDGPTFDRAERITVNKPAVARTVLVTRVRAVPNQFPRRGMGLDPLSELSVFPARSRHHRDKASAGSVDVVGIVVATQF